MRQCDFYENRLKPKEFAHPSYSEKSNLEVKIVKLPQKTSHPIEFMPKPNLRYWIQGRCYAPQCDFYEDRLKPKDFAHPSYSEKTNLEVKIVKLPQKPSHPIEFKSKPHLRY